MIHDIHAEAAGILAAMKPEAMALMLADIAGALDIEPPAGEASTLYFQRMLVEVVKANAKAAESYGVVANAFRLVMHGRL